LNENETWFPAKEEFPRFYQSWLGYSKRMTDWAKESQWDGEGERERKREMDSWERRRQDTRIIHLWGIHLSRDVLFFECIHRHVVIINKK
jgi:hypothetical protein